MEALLILAVLVCVFMVIAIPTIIFCKAMDFYYNKKEKKFNEKHPEYIEFRKKYQKLQYELSDIWNATMPDCRREVEYCIGEMKYYPDFSESYKYYKNKLNVAQRKIEKCKEEYDKKENEIYKLVQANKATIETIKDDDFDSYVSWVERFNLEVN